MVNDQTEALYLKKRHNTIKAAIQEGAHIVPAFFFGNSKLFHLVGAGTDGADSILAKMSRTFRASIILFYGRLFLPVPFRQVPISWIESSVVPAYFEVAFSTD